jgi:hypothetical protein
MILSKKEISEFEQILNLKYSHLLKGRSFEIKTSVNKESVEVQVVLRKNDDSFFYPVKSMANFSQTKLNNKELQMLLLDYVDMYFAEFFKEDESMYLPIDWSSYSFEGETIYLKGQVFNLKCEKQADQLLA